MLDSSSISGVSSLEKRIAENIERQRLDFQRQARLLEEVQRDVSRLQPQYASITRIERQNQEPDASQLNISQLNITDDMNNMNNSSQSRNNSNFSDRNSVRAALVRDSRLRTSNRTARTNTNTNTPTNHTNNSSSTNSNHNRASAQAQLRQVRELQHRLEQAEDQSIQFEHVSNTLQTTQDELKTTQHELIQEREIFQQERDGWQSKEVHESKRVDQGRDTIAALRSRVSMLEKQHHKETTKAITISNERKKEKTIHSQSMNRMQSQLKRTEEERTRLAEESLRLRAEASKLLSSNTEYRITNEKNVNQIETAHNEIVLLRTGRDPEMKGLKSDLTRLQTEKLELAGDVAALSTSLATTEVQLVSERKKNTILIEETIEINTKNETELEKNENIKLQERKELVDAGRKDIQELITRHDTSVAALNAQHEDAIALFKTEQLLRQQEQNDVLKEKENRYNQEKIQNEKKHTLKDAEHIQSMNEARAGHTESLSIYRQDIVRLETELKEEKDQIALQIIENKKINKNVEDLNSKYFHFKKTQEEIINKLNNQMKTLHLELKTEMEIRHAHTEQMRVLTSEMKTMEDKDSRMSTAYKESERLANQVPELLKSLENKKNIEIELNELKNEKINWSSQRNDLLLAGETLKKVMKNLNEEKILLDKTCTAQEDACSEWKWRCELAMRGIGKFIVFINIESDRPYFLCNYKVDVVIIVYFLCSCLNIHPSFLGAITNFIYF